MSRGAPPPSLQGNLTDAVPGTACSFGKLVSEMTPDNAWMMLEDPKMLVILLTSDKYPRATQKAMAAVQAVAARYREVANFAWADGSFASQFEGVARLPSVVTVETTSEGTAVYDPTTPYVAGVAADPGLVLP